MSENEEICSLANILADVVQERPGIGIGEARTEAAYRSGSTEGRIKYAQSYAISKKMIVADYDLASLKPYKGKVEMTERSELYDRYLEKVEEWRYRRRFCGVRIVS